MSTSQALPQPTQDPMQIKPLTMLMASALAAPLAYAADVPRFKAAPQASPLSERLYKAPAIATPYKPVLTVEEKVAGLSLFWAEARGSFVYFDHVPDLAWNKVYMDYLSKVIAAPTTRDYYRIMMRLAPLLQDGHTNIYPPRELGNEFYARPPMRTAPAATMVHRVSLSRRCRAISPISPSIISKAMKVWRCSKSSSPRS